MKVVYIALGSVVSLVLVVAVGFVLVKSGVPSIQELDRDISWAEYRIAVIENMRLNEDKGVSDALDSEYDKHVETVRRLKGKLWLASNRTCHPAKLAPLKEMLVDRLARAKEFHALWEKD